MTEMALLRDHGLFQIEWRENGRRLPRSLKRRDWRLAKRQANEALRGP